MWSGVYVLHRVLSVPVNSDKAVVEHCLCALYGPFGFFRGGKLDQRPLWVINICHLKQRKCANKIFKIMNIISHNTNIDF